MYIFGVVVTLTAAVALAQNDPDNIEAILNDIFGEACTLNGKIGLCLNRNQCTAKSQLRGSCSNALKVCCANSNATSLTTQPNPKKMECGRRNPINFRLEQAGLGNDKAKFGEFPWTATVLRKEIINQNGENRTVNVYVGGASIIHTSVVMTAAHTISNLENLFIRAGEWDTQTSNEPYPHQDRDVEEIVVHKNYSARNFANDIALLFLKKPLELAPNVGVVCLPEQNDVPAAGTRCFSSGWGKNSTGKEGKYQTIMKKMELPALNHSTCQAALRTTRLSKFFKLHSSFMCAGGEANQDTCQGDGGSPLVCPVGSESDRYMQSGIVAWGIGCGEDGIPAVYVNVASFRDWVNDNLNTRGYNPNVLIY